MGVITLIGYRGSGKSSVAEPLAARLDWDWMDADTELERRIGCSIRQLFETDGEARFRELEREVLVDLVQRDKLIIAAGGGAVLNADTRADFLASGPVVWLKAPADVLADRINRDPITGEQRPTLTDSGGSNQIREHLAQRELLYAESATLTVDTADKTIDSIVSEIVSLVSSSLENGG